MRLNHTPARSETEFLPAATLTYAAFIVYGSLVPLDFHYHPLAEAWDQFLHIPYLHLGIGSRADWVANILLYIPLGFLATGWMTAIARWRGLGASILVFCLCVTLAIAVEFTQIFFAPRTVSLNDIIAETIGSGIGIAVWLYAGERLIGLWGEVKQGGRHAAHAFIALYTFAYLALSLFPYDFLVSSTELMEKLGNSGFTAYFVSQSCGGSLSCSGKLLAEVLVVAPLGMFMGMVAAPGTRPSLWRAFVWGALLGVVIEGLQAFLASGISQGASIFTRGTGMALGLVIYILFRKEWLDKYGTRIKIAVLLALPLYLLFLLTLNGFFGSRLESPWVAYAKLQEVHFLPFYYHYFTSETQAMYSLLVHAGAYAPIGLAVWIFRNGQRERTSLWLPALAAAVVAIAMETMKLFLSGKKPDPTDGLIAAAAAALTYFIATRLTNWAGTDSLRSGIPMAEPARLQVPPTELARFHGVKLAGGLFLGVFALVGWTIAIQPKEHFVDESQLPRLPAAEELPPVILSHFKFSHPRLPSPTAVELVDLPTRSPGYMRELRDRANGGKGDIEAVTLQEMVEPGSVNLNLLHQRLMALKFDWRGHEQGKPLALAYDWLYPRWSELQRAELRGKLVEGCRYLIGVIRDERMSPYNVILYNAPMQGLMACSLAIYGDDPRGDEIMRFTYELWKNRVLPVWRQVMGQHGGWHEGGEYVGIGIGQAIFQLPNMWRSATGEDLFATEPGIRGFLDFLVYRTRPDGTHFRWGDGAWFDKIVPDAIPLALEYRNAPGYSLRPPGKEPVPAGWPWGPFTDSVLIDPAAFSRLPLTRYFDGIGMLVARSDWSADATYVTFKAGDNYWSHTHLDQGAFTIYKGGELAIDSGLYGPTYGSAHHMNYSYQTIAHNTITVTDPDDTVPAPGKDKPRPIANDGGQRRVGSGWGVESAPLDRAEWEAKRDIYHTAVMEQIFDRDDVTVAVADITPAYTNERSGNGTFSHRTRRVERFWRTFGYDRRDDVVVVFDQVIATKASFRKRWLLHTIEAPLVTPEGFSVSVPSQDRVGHAGGRLEGKVLLPKEANILPIGGRGFEFFVDDRNYDENGTLQNAIKKLGPSNGEPGAWRIEVSPSQDAPEDLFLVVLLPTAAGEHPTHQVRLLESGKRVGCEIIGPKRTTRWWFEPGRNGTGIEISEAGQERRYQVEGQVAPAPARQGWFDRVRSRIGQ